MSQTNTNICTNVRETEGLIFVINCNTQKKSSYKTDTFRTCARRFVGTQTKTINAEEKKLHKQRNSFIFSRKKGYQIYFYGNVKVYFLVKEIHEHHGVK